MRWLETWLIEAFVAAFIALFTMLRKSRRAGVPLTSPAARRFFVSYFAPIIAAAVITAMLLRAQWYEAMPAVWLLSYGASFISSVHARKLAEAKYIATKKGFAGKVPRTEYWLTASGKRALEKYLGHMEALIKSTRGA